MRHENKLVITKTKTWLITTSASENKNHSSRSFRKPKMSLYSSLIPQLKTKILFTKPINPKSCTIYTFDMANISVQNPVTPCANDAVHIEYSKEFSWTLQNNSGVIRHTPTRENNAKPKFHAISRLSRQNGLRDSISCNGPKLITDP